MTVAASSVVENAARLLADPTSATWDVADLVRWLNAGQIEIVTYKPDANIKVGTGTLAAGTRQDMTTMSGLTNPHKLIDITRNMASASAKGAVRQIAREQLDQQYPGWHADPASVNIVHFSYDMRDLRSFYVYPPALPTAQLEIVYAAYPTAVTVPASGGDYTSVAGNISVADIYSNCLTDYILYRAYLKESTATGNATRAVAYYTAFANAIGIEVKGTAADAPTP